jgi:biotin carboxyl carrier protein
MKVFSKVRSTVQGRIVEIGSANGEAVAKGQALFRIEQI